MLPRFRATLGTGLEPGHLLRQEHQRRHQLLPIRLRLRSATRHNFPTCAYWSTAASIPRARSTWSLSAAGSGPLADTGACTTTTPVELVVAGGTVVKPSSRIPATASSCLHLTQPNGNIAEQQITSVAGSCEATAPLELGDWVIQSVAFKVAPAVPPDFSMSSIPTTETVVAGSPAGPYAISVAAVGGFNSAVTLACDPSTLPTGAACGFVPNPVTPGAAPAGSNLTITTTGTTPAGTSNVKVTGTAGALVHNVIVTLTVTAPPVPDFTVAAGAFSPASGAAGGTATSTVTIAPLNGFNGTVNLTCAVTPAATPAPTCSLNPTSVPGGSGTSTLTFKSTAPVAASLAPWRGILYALWLPIGGLALLGTGSRWNRKKLLGLALVCLMISGLIFMAACGGGSSSGGGGGGGGGGQSGTPAGPYTVTVTATSGNLSHTATSTVTVQ